MSSDEIDDLFKQVNPENHDNISYSEFVSATMNQKNMLSEEKL